MSIRILFVEDNHLFRKGLAALISNDADYLVLGDVPGGIHVAQNALELVPDVVVMDLQLADIDSLETSVQIKHRLPDVRIVLLTDLKSEEHVRGALRAGIDGYVLKDTTAEEFKACLRAVADGRKFLSHDVSAVMVDSLIRQDEPRTGISRIEALTPRERSILQLVAEGRTNRSAAEYLNISPKTIEKHRSSMMHKLGLRNAAELTLAALDLGLIERPSSVARLSGELRGR